MSGTPANDARKVLILGDSHVHALKRACKRRAHVRSGLEFSAYRFSKLKEGVDVGDVSFAAALEMIAALTPQDLVVSAIGGNQHSVVGLVRHPLPFAIVDDGRDQAPEEGAQCIPYNALWDYFYEGLQGKDGERLTQMRGAAKCPVCHVAPPAPKADEAHILRRFEADFEKLGIRERGLSPAPLRLSLWRLQLKVLEKLCTQWDVRLVPPPSESLAPDGFLKSDYYADDATHANAAYGQLVLHQLEGIALGSAAPAETENARASV